MSTVLAFTDEVTATFAQPFYGGGSVAVDVPGKWPVALDGHGYLIDTAVEHSFTDFWQHESIPLIRTQADPSSFPNEATLNPQGLWRRFQDSAHHGAGQVYLDRDDEADPYRYHTSKGIDPWTKYKVGLHYATESKRTTSNTNLALVSAGSRLYIIDGQTLAYTSDVTGGSPTFSTVTGTNASAASALTSDGYNVYAGYGNGIALTNTGATSVTDAWNALVPSVLAYVKGRLMAVGTSSNANKIYNVTASGAAPSPLFTHPNAAFVWVGFSEGTANIYAAGYSGDKSLIYRIAVKPDASSLDQPIVAGELPDGEIIRSIGGYLGFVVLGTDKGWRFCDVDGQGNLTIGLLVTTAGTVLCFEPQDRFIWYGNTNYDGTSTGLGRMDITQFTQPLTPAYASDLMATGQGTILSVATFQNIRVFAVSALGFFGQTTLKVASGTIDSGLIGFGLPDQKTAIFLDVRTEPLAGSIVAYISVDNGAFVSIGTDATASSTGVQFPTDQKIGQHFEVRLMLSRDGTATTTGPIIERWTFKAFPTLQDGTAAEMIRIPVLLYRALSPFGIDEFCDVDTERDFIKTLRSTRRVVSLQEFSNTYTGFVDDYTWSPYRQVKNDLGKWTSEGTMVISFKRIV